MSLNYRTSSSDSGAKNANEKIDINKIEIEFQSLVNFLRKEINFNDLRELSNKLDNGNNYTIDNLNNFEQSLNGYFLSLTNFIQEIENYKSQLQSILGTDYTKKKEKIDTLIEEINKFSFASNKNLGTINSILGKIKLKIEKNMINEIEKGDKGMNQKTSRQISNILDDKIEKDKPSKIQNDLNAPLNELFNLINFKKDDQIKDFINIILNNKGNINSINKNKDTLFNYCCKKGYDEIAIFILDKFGKEVDVNKCNNTMDAPIMYIANNKLNEKLIDKIITFKVDLNKKNKIGDTSLFIALKNDNIYFIDKCCQNINIINYNITNNTNLTVVELAYDLDKYDIAKKLIFYKKKKNL